MTKSCAFVTHEGAAPSARQRRERRGETGGGEREVDDRSRYGRKNVRFVGRFRAGNTRTRFITVFRKCMTTRDVGFSVDLIQSRSFGLVPTVSAYFLRHLSILERRDVLPGVCGPHGGRPLSAMSPPRARLERGRD